MTGSSRILIGFSLVLLALSLLMIGHKLLVPACDPTWYIDKTKNTYFLIDFFQYYQASQLSLSFPDCHNVYNPETQRLWADHLVAPLSTNEVFYNQQPPIFFPLLLPLSFLPLNISYIAWCLLQTVFGLSFLFVLSGLGKLKQSDRLLLCLGVLSTFPAYICLWHGNTTFWLLGALSAYIYFCQKNRPVLSGLFLALSTFKPQYFFLMAMPLLPKKQWKVIVSFVCVELLLLALSTALIGIENVVNYPAIVKKAESYAGFIGVNPQVMISLRGFLSQFLSIHDSLVYTAIVMFTSIVPMFFLWKKFPQYESELWACTICLAVLLSPHAHVFDFLLVAMAAALTLGSLSVLNLSNEIKTQKIWTVFILVFPFASWLANFAFGHKQASIIFFFPFLLVLTVLSFLNLNGKAHEK